MYTEYVNIYIREVKVLNIYIYNIFIKKKVVPYMCACTKYISYTQIYLAKLFVNLQEILVNINI